MTSSGLSTLTALTNPGLAYAQETKGKQSGVNTLLSATSPGFAVMNAHPEKYKDHPLNALMAMGSPGYMMAKDSGQLNSKNASANTGMALLSMMNPAFPVLNMQA